MAEDAKVDAMEATARRVLSIVTNDASDLSHTIEQLRTIDDILGDIYIKVQAINSIK